MYIYKYRCINMYEDRQSDSCEALRHYTHIVLDEIHERDLDMEPRKRRALKSAQDLLCLLLKRSLDKNPNLHLRLSFTLQAALRRLVLMSATVDATQPLGDCALISSS